MNLNIEMDSEMIEKLDSIAKSINQLYPKTNWSRETTVLYCINFVYRAESNAGFIKKRVIK